MPIHVVNNNLKSATSPFAAVGAQLPPLIELREVEKSFPGRAQPVLTRLSFCILEGQFAVVVGGSIHSKEVSDPIMPSPSVV